MCNQRTPMKSSWDSRLSEQKISQVHDTVVPHSSSCCSKNQDNTPASPVTRPQHAAVARTSIATSSTTSPKTSDVIIKRKSSEPMPSCLHFQSYWDHKQKKEAHINKKQKGVVEKEQQEKQERKERDHAITKVVEICNKTLYD